MAGNWSQNYHVDLLQVSPILFWGPGRVRLAGACHQEQQKVYRIFLGWEWRENVQIEVRNGKE